MSAWGKFCEIAIIIFCGYLLVRYDASYRGLVGRGLVGRGLVGARNGLAQPQFLHTAAWMFWGVLGLTIFFLFLVVVQQKDFLGIIEHLHLHFLMEDSVVTMVRLGLLTMAWLLLLILLIPRWRRNVLPALGLNPRRIVHGVLFCYIIYALCQYVKKQQMIHSTPAFPLYIDFASLFGQIISDNFLMVALALLAVGYLVTRNGSETCKRLGLHRKLSWQALGAASMVALGMVLIYYIIDFVSKSLLLVKNTPIPLFTPGALFLVVVIPSIAEEILFRGVLLPRLGSAGTSFLFALHHPQYTWCMGISLFLGSLLACWLGHRYGLQAAMVAHGLNNLIIGIMAWYL